MPQTKPLMWPVFLISIFLMLMLSIIKNFHNINMKSPLYKKIKFYSFKMKW